MGPVICCDPKWSCSDLKWSCCDLGARFDGDKVNTFMTNLGLGGPFHTNFWITGVKADGKRIDTEGASIWYLAWRTLYAQVTYSHIHNTYLNTDRAYAKLAQMTLSRVKAYGGKWYLWYSKQRYHKKKQNGTQQTQEIQINHIHSNGKLQNKPRDL